MSVVLLYNKLLIAGRHAFTGHFNRKTCVTEALSLIDFMHCFAAI